MICTTIQNKNFEEIGRILGSCEMAEIRLDRCELSLEEIEELFNTEVPLVATCRVSEMAAGMVEGAGDVSAAAMRVAAGEAEKRLLTAVRAGAAYVDVEIEAPREMLKRVRAEARESGALFIVSSHDFEATGTGAELKETVEKCFRLGADIVKLVTTARTADDAARVTALYDEYDPAKLIAFCMGDAGRQSRVDCLRRGAQYTYAALTEADAAAPGQWAVGDMMREVYGDFHFYGWAAEDAASRAAGAAAGDDGVAGDAASGAAGAVAGDDGVAEPCALRMPASKSFAQRAIIAAALADGESHLEAYTPCSDSEAALAVAASLGAEVRKEYPSGASGDGATEVPAGASGDGAPNFPSSPEAACQAGAGSGDEAVLASGGAATIIIKGIGAKAGSVDLSELSVGESGLLTRLMIPLTSQISASDVTLHGEKTLLSRPLKGASDMMSRFGVYLSGETVPLKVSGSLADGKAEISGRYGSQMISGLLMAEALGEKDSTIVVREPKSIPYMFITLDVLKQFGVKVASEMDGGQEFVDSDGDWSKCEEITFRVKGGQKYSAADLTLEGDWSAAANFLVVGAIFGKVRILGLDTTSLQADLSIIDILADAGAGIVQEEGDKGPMTVRRSPLIAFETDASNCPDLFPIISVLAAFCQGTSRIAGVDRLAHKESDRGTAIVNMLTQMGVKTAVEGNVLVIEGHSLTQRCLTGTLLKGGNYTSCHDHRMAMALKVAELGADSPIVIDDEACVAKSFPSFFDTFRRGLGC